MNSEKLNKYKPYTVEDSDDRIRSILEDGANFEERAAIPASAALTYMKRTITPTNSSPVSIGCSRPCSGRPYGLRQGSDDGSTWRLVMKASRAKGPRLPPTSICMSPWLSAQHRRSRERTLRTSKRLGHAGRAHLDAGGRRDGVVCEAKSDASLRVVAAHSS